MDGLFFKLLNMSLTASWIILVVLGVRLLLRHAPKRYAYLLWAAPLVRLLCPVSFKGGFSLVPSGVRTAANGVTTIATQTEPVAAVLPDMAHPASLFAVSVPAAATGLPPPWLTAAAVTWLAGAVGLVIYGGVTLLKLNRTLRMSMPLGNRVYAADGLSTAFVIGLIKPAIYLPSSLCEEERVYVLLHERAHIRRGDHIVKLLAFAALCLHWFNPLVWIAFLVSSRDMEASCDEMVMQRADRDIRAVYSASLLTLASGRRVIAGVPLAFSEGNTKSRIKNVLRYKKPVTWVTAVCVVAVAAVSVGLLFDTKTSPFLLDSPTHSEARFTRSISEGDLGVGLAGEMGSPVYAAGAGTVLTANYEVNYGNYILIDHGDGTRSFYAHNSENLVQAGDVVEQGQIIATLGRSGVVTAPTLHFAVQVGGQWVDPKEFVAF